MIIDIAIPSPGESVTEVAIGNWLVEDGDYVEKDQEIAEVETDKATLPLIAAEAGKVSIKLREGEKANPGDVACTVDTSAKPARAKQKVAGRDDRTTSNVMAGSSSNNTDHTRLRVTPVARKLMEEHNLDAEDIIKGLKKISRREVEAVLRLSGQSGDELQSVSSPQSGGSARSEKESGTNQPARNLAVTPMSPLRRKLGKRLVAVRNETAMLTTFNEVDMGMVLSLRKKYQQAFQETHGIKLGLMSFFMKACALVIRDYPAVNSMIEDENILTPDYVDISIAVQTEKGLMVPVVRNVERLGLAEIEKQISELAQKARNGRLSIEEMTGGTFTITNGGVFGSMLSTPIINPPQSAILGMHNITDRPSVRDGRIDIRPVMYLALSYDHRLIDGRDSVSFLSGVKELIENPSRLTGEDHDKTLLGL